MTHHKQPLEPDTELAIKKLQEKGYKVAPKNNGNKRLIALLGTLAAIIIAVPVAIDGGDWCMAMVHAPRNIKTCENRINTNQNEISNVEFQQSRDRDVLTNLFDSIADLKRLEERDHRETRQDIGRISDMLNAKVLKSPKEQGAP